MQRESFELIGHSQPEMAGLFSNIKRTDGGKRPGLGKTDS